MTTSTTFTRFPDLSPELQVMIVNYTLEEDMAQPEDELILHLHAPSSCKSNDISDASMATAPCATIRLPKLPAVYHTSRLFRNEALRTQPLHQIFTEDALKRLHSHGSMHVNNIVHNANIHNPHKCRCGNAVELQSRGSMAIYNSPYDTVLLQAHNCCLSAIDADLEQLFHVIKATLWAPRHGFIFAIGEPTRLFKRFSTV